MKYIIPIAIVVVVIIALAAAISVIQLPTVPTGPSVTVTGVTPAYQLPTTEFRSGPVTEFTSTGDMVTNMQCSDTAVKLKLTNIGSNTWTIGTDVIFYVNSYPDSTPGCDKTTLAPGEFTLCSGLDAVGLGYQPTIVVDTPARTDVKRIDC